MARKKKEILPRKESQWNWDLLEETGFTVVPNSIQKIIGNRPTMFLVYFVLLQSAPDKLIVDGGRHKLAKLTGLSPETVRKTLEELAKAGLIEKVSEKQGIANRYYLKATEQYFQMPLHDVLKPGPPKGYEFDSGFNPAREPERETTPEVYRRRYNRKNAAVPTASGPVLDKVNSLRHSGIEVADQNQQQEAAMTEKKSSLIIHPLESPPRCFGLYFDPNDNDPDGCNSDGCFIVRAACEKKYRKRQERVKAIREKHKEGR